MVNKENNKEKLENWNNFLHTKLRIPEKFELINKDKPKDNKPYVKFILIFLGLCVISLALFYNGYQGNYKSDISCNGTTICESQSCLNNCDKECAPNNCDCDCPDFPSDLNIILEINETQ